MSHLPIVSDSLWVNHWPERSHQPPADLRAGITNTAATMQRLCIDHHRRAVNVTF